MATQLPRLADVEQLSLNVIRILGGNPSKFTLQGTNTYLLGQGPSRILLDTGEGKASWKKNLSLVLKSQSATISSCILSHWHHDHIGGVDDLLGLCPKAKIYKNTPSLNPDGILKGDVLDISDGEIFTVGEEGGGTKFAVKAVHCPGHTQDHMSFVVSESPEKSEVGAMFTGDNVLGHGTAVFEDLATYLSSLRLMSAHIPPGVRAYPAHGQVLEDGKDTIEMYIQHRQQREDEALRVLKTGRADKAADETPDKEVPVRDWQSMEIVKIIYKDVPENLHQPAERGLLQVLKKLEGEGKVVRTEGGKWRIGKKAAL